MKLGVLFGILLISSYTAAEFCYNDVEAACNAAPPPDGALLPNCDAKYGGFETLLADLQAFANAQIETSFEYLLMSTHFENFEANRPGFAGLYRKLSDRSWDNAIDILKFIVKRGGKMNFNQPPRIKRNTKDRLLELTELPSLARALDSEKKLAEEALRIHTQSQHHAKHDGSVAHYMEEKFFGPQADIVKELAGYTADMKSLVSDRDASISVFFFDDYLKSLI